MLQPARRKYRKEQKGRNTGLATRGANVSFGEFGNQPSYQAWRSYLDPNLPRQAYFTETG